MRSPKDIHVLVACEESQRVCMAFRKRGFSAWSCDVQQCSGGHPEFHIDSDVLQYLDGHCNFYTEDGRYHLLTLYCWDLIIAHPPCTDLAVSGARWFKEKQSDGRQQKSIDFFLEFVRAESCCDHIAIENPISIMSTYYRKPDQIIQPWQFGHGEVKATCLWLYNLPLLRPTNIVKGRDPKVWKMGSGHSKERSKTYIGIAEAMASQWGDYLLEVL